MKHRPVRVLKIGVKLKDTNYAFFFHPNLFPDFRSYKDNCGNTDRSKNGKNHYNYKVRMGRAIRNLDFDCFYRYMPFRACDPKERLFLLEGFVVG